MGNLNIVKFLHLYIPYMYVYNYNQSPYNIVCYTCRGSTKIFTSLQAISLQVELSKKNMLVNIIARSKIQEIY